MIQRRRTSRNPTYEKAFWLSEVISEVFMLIGTCFLVRGSRIVGLIESFIHLVSQLLRSICKSFACHPLSCICSSAHF